MNIVRHATSLVLALVIALPALPQEKSYEVTSVKRSRITIDETYDRDASTKRAGEKLKEAEAFLAPYKHQVDSIMAPVVGHSARYMEGDRPESLLSNLLADILVWAGTAYGEKPVMGLYNMGGIRATLPEGAVTYGDIVDIAPFENKICFLTLSGHRLKQLFENIALVGGEGVSKGVELVISKDRKLISARLNGQEIDPEANYRIATIDYLAEGNDRMEAFKYKTMLKAPQDELNDTRFIIADYFRAMERKGIIVDAQIEGRITINEEE